MAYGDMENVGGMDFAPEPKMRASFTAVSGQTYANFLTSFTTLAEPLLNAMSDEELRKRNIYLIVNGTKLPLILWSQQNLPNYGIYRFGSGCFLDVASNGVYYMRSWTFDMDRSRGCRYGYLQVVSNGTCTVGFVNTASASGAKAELWY